MTPQSTRPLPTTTEGWLIQISGDIQATNETVRATNEKIERLIDGAIKLDGRLDTVQAWKDQVSPEVARLREILDWKQEMQGEIRGIKVLAAIVASFVGIISGLVGATVAVMTNLANLFGGKHP